MKKIELFTSAYAVGMALVLWVAATAMLSNPLVLVMTLLIGAVFTWGMQELNLHRKQTLALRTALQSLTDPLTDLNAWLQQLPPVLQSSVSQRIRGARVAPPAPAMTSYLVGLLVMLGMLGTFLGMVLTLSGTAFALQSLTDIQGIRVAFSEPIKGLGLAFGASVAGVGTSAMLGFMSTLVRKERLQAWGTLEERMESQLHGHTSEQRQEQSLQAIEQHLQIMPELVLSLNQWMQRMESQQAKAGSDLQIRQEAFQTEARQQHLAWVEALDLKLRDQLSQTFGQTSAQLQEMSRAVLGRLELQAHTLHEEFSSQHQNNLQQQMQQMHQWVAQIESAMVHQWNQIGSGLQGALTQWTDLTQQATQAAAGLMNQMGQLIADHSGRDHHLLQERTQLMAQLTQLTQLLDQQIGQLSQIMGQELQQLSQGLSHQVSELSQALKQEMTQLSQTFGQQSQQISHDFGQQAQHLSQTFEHQAHQISQSFGLQAQQLSQSFDQQATHISQRFEQHIERQDQHTQDLDGQLQASAIEMQALAQSFAEAVQALLDSQHKTLHQLQQTDQTLAQSVARSDEQLAYYVAQAKEVIELSLSAQKPMLQALERASQAASHKERA
jgi:hypothetical protein